MYCPKCGNQLNEKTAFCPFCGADLTAYQNAPEVEPPKEIQFIEHKKEKEDNTIDKNFPRWLIFTLSGMAVLSVFIIVALFSESKKNTSNTAVSSTYRSSGSTYQPSASSTSTYRASTSTSGTTQQKITTFHTASLKNWTDEELKKRYGKTFSTFRPSNPQPMTYFVRCNTVKDPVTGRTSKGGRNHFTARHLPVNTNDVLTNSGNLRNAGLTLTSDPNKASFCLELNFYYVKSTTFTFSDGSRIYQYKGVLNATVKNLVTGKSIKSKEKSTYATYTGERVQRSMLNAAKGKQLYAGTPSLYLTDFPEGSSFF